jgi:hypothetical protein
MKCDYSEDLLKAVCEAADNILVLKAIEYNEGHCITSSVFVSDTLGNFPDEIIIKHDQDAVGHIRLMSD